jgi:hypothetical protein
MITLLLIIFFTSAITLIISYLLKYFSYSEKEEDRLPVENYELFEQTKTKIKKQKSKTKK